MHLLQPSLCECHSLQLPRSETASGGSVGGGSQNLDAVSDSEIILDPIEESKELNCRVGSAAINARSTIFVYGGLVVPINIDGKSDLTVDILEQCLNTYFNKEVNVVGNISAGVKLCDYLSNDIFYLDLIQLKWYIMKTTVSLKPCPRFFQSICHDGEKCLYLHGGLKFNSYNEFVACNDLWKFDLKSKSWTLLVEQKELVVGRYNHSISFLDDKIYVIGGRDKNGDYVKHIDIFDLRCMCWRTRISLSQEIFDDSSFMLDKSNSVTTITNNDFSDDTYLLIYENDKNIASNAQTESSIKSPITVLQLCDDELKLIPDNLSDSSDIRNLPRNLSQPSGSLYETFLVVTGYAMENGHNKLFCYAYDIKNGSWREIDVTCQRNFMHYFWHLSIWKSHKLALCLGTECSFENNNKNYHIQQFDKLMTVYLPILTSRAKNVNKRFSQLSSCDKNVNSVSSLYFTKNDAADKMERIPSTIPVSKFENYIKYTNIPTVDALELKSIFPSYSMVLGKDAFEIFGNSLSDFELVTNEGDSIGVPIYLLRIRWGRYFDYLLSRGYTNVGDDYENTALDNSLLKLSQVGIGSNSLNSMNEKPDLSASFSNTDIRRDRSAKSLNSLQNFDQDSKLRQTKSNDRNPELAKTATGMLFRMPFADTIKQQLSQHPLPLRTTRQSSTEISTSDSPLTNNEERKYSGAFNSDNNIDVDVSVNKELRPSISKFSKLELREEATPPKLRRNSSLSLRSNSSGNRFNSSDRLLSNGSSIPQTALLPSIQQHQQQRLPKEIKINESQTCNGGIAKVIVALPPAPEEIDSPLPRAPTLHSINHANSRKSSLISNASRFANSSSSPFSSRRSSNFLKSSIPESEFKRSTSYSSLDKLTLSNNQLSGQSTGLRNIFDRKQFNSLTSQPIDEGPFDTNFNMNTKKDFTASLPVTGFDIEFNSRGNLSIDLDPLLVPRCLYIPWSTATVEAFAEFFYTSKINRRWLLSPTVLNLLVMSKIYEVPKLYNSVLEVLFTVISKKEENLLMTCVSLKKNLETKFLSSSSVDDTINESRTGKMKNFVDELSVIHKSLLTINEGFLETDYLDSVSTTTSVSFDEARGVSRFSSLASRGSTSNINSSQVPVSYRSGSKDSQFSVGSAGHPTKLNFPLRSSSHTSPSAKFRKKLNLEKEYNSECTDDDEMSHFNSQFRLQSTLKDQEKERSTASSESDSTSSRSDFDDSMELGGLSMGKMEREVNQANRIEESIDPLFKLNYHEATPSHDENTTFLRQISAKASSKDAGGTTSKSTEFLMLENLLSSNSLPPVDYVIKTIQRTAVLVNDVRLLARCTECVRISRIIEDIKKALVVALENPEII